MAMAKYFVQDVDEAIAFYQEALGFTLRQDRRGPAFAWIMKGDQDLLISCPGTSAAKPLLDGGVPEPGGFLTEGLASGSAVAFPADQEIPAEYGEMATKPQEMFAGFAEAFSGPDAPDPQEVAEAIANLIDLPAGQRPLRTVVGTLMTAGVRELNEQFDRSRQQLHSSLGMA